jgi:serine/threonine protein phosphatase PrpC
VGETSWVTCGASVRGAAHFRSGQPNQDSICWSRPEQNGRFNVLAVADGHGSAKAFRSDRGSRLAASTAVDQMLAFPGSEEALLNLSAIKRMARETMPQALVRRWTEAVENDLRSESISVTELQALTGKGSTAARDAVEHNQLIAYGSTIMIAALTESFAVCLQLGDGDIICVSDEGECTRPMENDERLFANETTSLCAPEAWKDFRVHFQVFSERWPAMIMLSTDGYSNSYQDDSGFLKVGTDILSAIRSDGWETVKASLPDWLSQTSKRGSGDDITVGLIVRRDIVEGRLR